MFRFNEFLYRLARVGELAVHVPAHNRLAGQLDNVPILSSWLVYTRRDWAG